MMNRARKLIVALSCTGLLWCVAVGLLLWFLPFGSSESGSASGMVVGGQTFTSSGPVVVGDGQSFAALSALGPVPLIIPVVLMAIGTWSALRRHKLVLIGTTILSALFAFLTGFSIGLFYLPAVALLVVECVIALSPSVTPGEAAG
jgi:hypothetical protein